MPDEGCQMGPRAEEAKEHGLSQVRTGSKKCPEFGDLGVGCGQFQCVRGEVGHEFTPPLT